MAEGGREAFPLSCNDCDDINVNSLSLERFIDAIVVMVCDEVVGDWCRIIVRLMLLDESSASSCCSCCWVLLLLSMKLLLVEEHPCLWNIIEGLHEEREKQRKGGEREIDLILSCFTVDLGNLENGKVCRKEAISFFFSLWKFIYNFLRATTKAASPPWVNDA